MNKLKTLVLILIITLSSLVGINKVKALDTCDFDNYGTFELRTQKEVNSGDWTKNGIGYYETSSNISIDSGAQTASGSCNGFAVELYGCWKNTEQNWYVVYAWEGGYINTAKFTVITENDDTSISNYYGTKQCEYEVNVKELCEQIEGQTCETFKFMFTLNKKNIKFINFEGTYYDSDGNLQSFGENTFLVNKAGSEGAGGVDHTTIAGKAIQVPITKHIDSGSEIESVAADAGTASATATNTISDATGNAQGACNSINELFNEYWPYIMVLVPVALIILITLDFFKAMSSSDADAIKKAGTNTVKRTIAGVLLLALPALLGFVFEYFGLDFCL